jgi:hypothetical protein
MNIPKSGPAQYQYFAPEVEYILFYQRKKRNWNDLYNAPIKILTDGLEWGVI